MHQSEQIDKLALALCKAQSQMMAAKKDSENPFFHSNYADLSSVWQAVRQALSDNGLSVAQGGGVGPHGNFIWTTLLHSSGQWLRGEMPLVLGKNDPQGVGAATTYYRRYSLAAMLGVIQEDDDAESAMPRNEPQARSVEKVRPVIRQPQRASAGAPEAYEPEPPGDLEDEVPLDEPPVRGDIARGKISSVATKTGKSAKGPWTRYGVCVNKEWYNTFDVTIGKLAEHCKAKGSVVEIAFTDDGKGKKIEQLIVVPAN